MELDVAGSIDDSYLESTAAEGKGIIEVLEYLFDQVLRARSSTAVELGLKLSKFPVGKTLEEFDLSAQSSIDSRVM